MFRRKNTGKFVILSWHWSTRPMNRGLQLKCTTLLQCQPKRNRGWPLSLKPSAVIKTYVGTIARLTRACKRSAADRIFALHWTPFLIWLPRCAPFPLCDLPLPLLLPSSYIFKPAHRYVRFHPGLPLTSVRAYYTPENLTKTPKITWPLVQIRQK